MATSYTSWANYASTSVSIRLKYDVTETDTTFKITVTAQRWDKYALVPSGSCWLWLTDAGYSSAMSFPSASSNNSTRNIGSMTHTYNKTTSAQTITLWFETDQWFDTITDSGWTRVGVVKPSWTVTIPKKPSYTVKYAANGGSSTPSSQTKWHGTALTLAAGISRANASATAYTVTLNHNYSGSTNTTRSAARTTHYTFSKWKATSGTLYSAKASYTSNASTTMTAQWSSSTTTSSVTLTSPTRSGYTFDGWATSSTGSKAYDGGASFTPSSSTTLYARWYRTVTFNANGGSRAPAAQRALATSAIKLSTVAPTRTGYKFTGWNTKANGTGTSYASGASYPVQNPSVTLYAQWEILLTVSITSVTRCDANGTTDPLGSCAKVVFNWSSGSGSSVAASFNVSLGSQSTTVTRTAASGTETAIVSGLNPRTAYTATVTGTVASAGTSVSTTKSAPVAYTSPVINSVATNRVNASQVLDDEGTVLKLDVKWSVCQSLSQTVTMTVQAKDQNGAQLFPQPVSLTVPAGTYSGTDTFYVNDEEFSVDSQYTVTVTVTDALNVSVSKGSVLSTAYFPMDVLGDQHYYQTTTDTAIDPDKRYYAMDEDSGWYKLVEEPTVADIGSYYEATGPRPGHGISFGSAAKEEGFNVSMPMMMYEEQCYPTFTRSSWSTSSNETNLPVTPCFVLDTTTGALYFCSGSGIARINEGTDTAHPGTVRSDGAIAFNVAPGSNRCALNRSGDYLYITASDANGDGVGSYRFNMTTWGIAYRVYENGAWGSWETHIWNSAASRTANTVLAAPNGSAGAATFRKLVAADCDWIDRQLEDKDDNVSVANSTWVKIASITCPAGTWVISGTVYFASNSTGRRYACIHSASPTTAAQRQASSNCNAVSGAQTFLNVAGQKAPTSSTTYGLYAYQTSGSALNATGFLSAVRIK